MKDAFEKVYATNEWRHGSGEGSLPAKNTSYIAYLQAFMKQNDVRSVVDLGCGDWQFSRYVDWSGVAYDGFDLVESVISHNRSEFSRDNIRFHLFDGDWSGLPEADLLIAKDVLQHWSNATIASFLPTLSQYRHALITNCVGLDGPPQNRDIKDGAFRYLDLRSEPFHLKATEVHRFEDIKRRKFGFGERYGWRKIVLLHERVDPMGQVAPRD